MKTIYIDIDGGDDWRDWIKRNDVRYVRFMPFPMCGGIRLDGVSHYPIDKPDFVRYGDDK